MQLQPLVKREPYRPPPRLPEDREPDDADEKDPGANEPAEESRPIIAESPAEVVGGPCAASTEIDESTTVVKTSVDSAPISLVPDPRPESDDDGFGAGLEGSGPPDPPPDEAATRRA